MTEIDDISIRWKSNWWKYNLALVLSGFLAFLCYCFVGSIYIPAPCFEVTIFTMFFQGIAYLIMMGIANLVYAFCMNHDVHNSYDTNSISHKILFYGIFIVSCALPFMVPLMIVVSYHDGYPCEERIACLF